MIIKEVVNMAWDESIVWRQGENSEKYYQEMLQDAVTKTVRDAERKKSLSLMKCLGKCRARAC